ncbi:uncharacterized protein RSE6_11612 [Rhynchosporium secalis]|uniref:Uncharacterized protein n=1 Tax=Rhynchosporium secalis TaxID=38038 RepID=A0A1E1MND5_RHYSE|nr:uncharacterized protein RSE6_11612 [Rhynchosporium secalis]
MRSFSIMLVLGISILTSAQDLPDLPTHLGDQGECMQAYQCTSGVCEGNYGKARSSTGARCHGSGNKGGMLPSGAFIILLN